MFGLLNGEMAEFRMVVWLYGCMVIVFVDLILDCKMAVCLDGYRVDWTESLMVGWLNVLMIGVV